MPTKWLMIAPVAGALGIGAGIGFDQLSAAAPGDARQDVKPAVTLPITRVVLFNSGVGYFSRSGEVVDDARVDLTFPEQDVNDLLKSMVLEDFNGGRIAAVNYDSREPITRTLSSFAVNLNGNPTFAGILSQMRGERVDVVLTPGAANQPGKLSGVIVGVEKTKVPAGNAQIDTEVLNMWCAEGLRSVKLPDVQQLKFANPVIESEFRRALDVLSLSHDAQKKSVSLHFAGDGKRKVQVGYVIEAPIWKTSYRLVLGEKEKPYLQGWAMVENPTDEDWAGVKMALISGRPISFKMDLYNPLYMNRPVVEPELFASLRPVTYRGGFGREGQGATEVSALVKQYHDAVKRQDFGAAERLATLARQLDPDNPAITGLAEMAKVSNRLLEAEKQKSGSEKFTLSGLNAVEGYGPGSNSTRGYVESVIMGGGGNGAIDESKLRQITNQWGYMPAGQRAKLFADVTRDLPAKYRPMVDEYFQTLNKVHGYAGIDYAAVASAATAGALGDFFQYTIDHPVSLARQKSAMLPIVGKDVEGQKVSIYNQFVQAKHPLLGLKFKNTSGAHLNQGPITVFEGSVYAGDTRVLDVQPNEERLISYAIDLGTEVDAQVGPGTQKITSVKAVKGIVTTVTKVMEEKKYKIINRSQTDRTLVIEHANRTNQQFKLVDTEKPMEDTPDVYRFQTPVKAGETKTFTVKEEKDVSSSLQLTNNADDTIRYFINLAEASPALKQKLKEALAIKADWDGTRRELTQVVADLQRLNADQDRIRKNLRETPKEAEVYGTYLKKLNDQEKEIDALTAKQKKLMTDEFAARKKYDDYLGAIAD